MKSRFLAYLQQLVPSPENAKFLLAVSGGSDSCALAHLFYSSGFQFDIAHCNFHLREEESDEDMQFVMKLSIQYQCGFLVKEFYHEDFRKKEGNSIEMIARDFRYQWFEELAPKYDYIVTAHHANDNAETLLLNLLRGTGLKGLTGIPVVNGKIIRPLLHFPVSEILCYLRDHHLEFRVDRTNLTEKYKRNKIRLNIIPKLEEINPALVHTLKNDMDVLRKQYDFYAYHMAIRKEQLIRKSEEKTYISIEALLSEKFAELCLYEIISDYGFHADTVRQIMRSLHKQPGKKFLSSSHILIKDRNQLIISPVKETRKEAVEIKDIWELEKYGFEVEQLTKGTPISFTQSRQILYVDEDKLCFPLLLRKWEKADFFFPLGMKGKKKVSDLFNDLKIDCLSKQDIPILCSGKNIVWVVGYRADDRFKIDSKTRNIFKIYYYGLL